VHVVTGSLLFEALPELGGQAHNASASTIKRARIREMYHRTKLLTTGRRLETDADRRNREPRPQTRPRAAVLAHGSDYLDDEERVRLHQSIERGMEDVKAGRIVDGR
jgi:hypothetical protein